MRTSRFSANLATPLAILLVLSCTESDPEPDDDVSHTDTGGAADSSTVDPADRDPPNNIEPDARAGYDYVMVVDPGASPRSIVLFEISLTKDGQTYYPATIVDSQIGPHPDATRFDPQSILGPAGDVSEACAGEHVLDLAGFRGESGWVIVSFSGQGEGLISAEPGDLIDVKTCRLHSPDTSWVGFYIRVGNETVPDSPNWVQCGEEQNRLGTCTVPSPP